MLREKDEQIKELEKENAELRKDKEELCHAISEGGKACLYLKELLTKAKRYIKELLRAVESSYSVLSWQRPPIKAEAEQFLKEIEQ